MAEEEAPPTLGSSQGIISPRTNGFPPSSSGIRKKSSIRVILEEDSHGESKGEGGKEVAAVSSVKKLEGILVEENEKR